MCGIVGYVGNQQAAPILLERISKLEYRGYDSVDTTWHNECSSLDATLVLAMCDQYSLSGGYDYVKGTCSINTDSASLDYGVNSFAETTAGKHYYLKRKNGRGTTYFINKMNHIMEETDWAIRKSGRVRLRRM